MSEVEGVPTCRCGLPFLRSGTGWCCPACDQGVVKGRTVAAHWFLRWQREYQAEIDRREG